MAGEEYFASHAAPELTVKMVDGKDFLFYYLRTVAEFLYSGIVDGLQFLFPAFRCHATEK